MNSPGANQNIALKDGRKENAKEGSLKHRLPDTIRNATPLVGKIGNVSEKPKEMCYGENTLLLRGKENHFVPKRDWLFREGQFRTKSK